MKKLLLINPVGRRSGLLLSRFSTFQPLGLAYVAAATPSNWHVEIADENFDEIQLEDADFAANTASIKFRYDTPPKNTKATLPLITSAAFSSQASRHQTLQPPR